MLRQMAAGIRAAEGKAMYLEDFRFPVTDYDALKLAQARLCKAPNCLGAEQVLRRAETENLQQQLAAHQSMARRLRAMGEAADRLKTVYQELFELFSAAKQARAAAPYKKCRKSTRT